VVRRVLRSDRRYREDLDDPHGTSPDVYVCGPPAMVDAAAEVARVNGVDDEHLILERYLPTGA
jgi:ferredoxin-NADP reductase